MKRRTLGVTSTYRPTYCRFWCTAKHRLGEFLVNTVILENAKFGLSRYSIVHSLRNRDAMIRHVITAIGMYISSPCFRSAVWGAFPKLRLWPLSSATLTLTTCGKKNQIKMWPIRVMKACVECFRTWNQINVNLMQLWNVLCAFVSSIPHHVSTDRQKTHKKNNICTVEETE